MKRKEPIPASLRTVESASEDIIDLALAGKRAAVVERSRELEDAAKRQGGAALETSAARVGRLAPSAPLLDVAVASNETFALVPDLFARYDTPVPASVTRLDYFDFEIKLESKAGDTAKLRRAVVGLQTTWDSLRDDVPDARAAERFDAHVKQVARLTNAAPERMQREAQHGLDLVDELEESFQS